MTTIGDGPAGLARVVKSGQDTLVTDEAIKRRNMDPVEKGLRKLVNSQGKAIDGSIISLIASAVTATGAAAAVWTGQRHGDPPGHPQGQGAITSRRTSATSRTSCWSTT
jgi:hypothetical protein